MGLMRYFEVELSTQVGGWLGNRELLVIALGHPNQLFD
jgi:hypothetical protein